MKSLLNLFLFFGHLSFLLAYNMDVEKPLIYFGVAGDQFGYSTEILSNNEEKRIVIGAPATSLLPESNRSGLLFSCPVEPMEPKTNFSGCVKVQPEMALAERFGSTIHRYGGSVVVCSPLRGLFLDRDVTAGGCDLFFKNMTWQGYLNIRAGKVNDKYPEHASGMYGFSIIAENDSSVVLGGPNACGNDGGLALFTNVSETADYLYSSNCSRFFGGYYYGYALNVMKYKNETLYVVGSPGFSNKKGVIGLMEVVKIVTKSNKPSLAPQKQITGLQNGGGFGQSLSVIDVNGDGLDDIIVGAPLEYINVSSKSSVIIDVGNVYVYLGYNGTIIHDIGIRITGDLIVSGRFGSAVGSIGDINDDSFQDVAVGAPFENDMRGAIYIFNGCLKGCVEKWKYTQKIHASTININLRGFGFYISRSQEDIDNNEYKDFAVGSYKSGMAVVLRSRPIISIEPKIIFQQNPVPLNSSGLNCSKGNDYPCLDIKVCFNLTGKGIQSVTYVNFTLWGDVSMTNKRINMDGNESSVDISDFMVYGNKSSCKTLQAVVSKIGMSFFKSIIEPLEFKVNLSLSGRTPEFDVLPILRKGSVTSHQNNVTFRTSCAQNEKCQPKFSGNAEINDHKDNGEFETFKMDFILRNHGDPASATTIEILKTKKAVYSGLVISVHSEKVICKETNSTIILCNVTTDPFYQHMLVQISLDFKIDPQNNDATGYVDFNISVQYVPSGRSTRERSNITYEVLKQLAVVSVGGEPSQDQREMDTNSEMMIHEETFRVYNRGPSTVDGLILQIGVPWSIAGVQILSKLDYDKGICNLTTNADMFVKDKEVKSKVQPDAKPQVDTKQNSLFINCSQKDVKCHLLQCKIKKLARDNLDDIKLTLNLTTNILHLLEKAPVIKYITSGKLISNHSDFEGNLRMTNGEIVLTIIPKKIVFETRKIDLGVVIGGSVGGFVFLIIIGIILWKVGFFKRKKRQQVDEFKRRTALLKRQSRMSKISRVDGPVKVADQ
ncbi:integrin alpha-9-like [Saccostrea echinata]|uniref:integrin alpha-9-like n=1 Tax=Saccostrea echinata TaxID=191078 RepID=UPI002A7EFA3A|nr:integrin alpha-9-like [Saccostrea echinata]